MKQGYYSMNYALKKPRLRSIIEAQSNDLNINHGEIIRSGVLQGRKI